MSCNYAVFFDLKTKNYNGQFRLPVNPEEITETSSLAIEKYEILSLGQIAIPTHLELRKFSFDAEFPNIKSSYITNETSFMSAKIWLEIFEECRKGLIPIKFVFGPDNNGNNKVDKGKGESVSVLIEELEITEKAGEEGDKYIKLTLLEYKDYSVGKVTEIKKSSTSGKSVYKKKKSSSSAKVNKKSTGTHVVRSGDTLWGIAKIHYDNGSKYKIIYNANKDKIKNPALLTVGWKLKIPPEDELANYS